MCGVKTVIIPKDNALDNDSPAVPASNDDSDASGVVRY